MMCWLGKGLFIGLMIIGLVACTPAAAPATPLPTQPLIPATDTPTPQPTQPTATPVAVVAPVDVRPTATLTTLMPVLASDATIAQALTNRLRNTLAQELNMDATRITLGRVVDWQWPNPDLPCDAFAGDAVSSSSVQPVLSAVQRGQRIEFVVGVLVYPYHTTGNRRIKACPAYTLSGDLLMAVDPIAADMVAIARRQVAQQLDLSSRRVMLVDVRPMTWPDTSLGCPQASDVDGDTPYVETAIEGYRIVMEAAGNAYIFHTDEGQLYACAAEDELLPPSAN